MMDTEGKRSLEFQSFETNISFLKNVNLVFYHKHQNWKGTRVEAERNVVTNVFKFIFYFYRNNSYAEFGNHIILHGLK